MIVTHSEATRIAEGHKTQHRLPRSRRCPDVMSSVPVSYRERSSSGVRRFDTITACRIQVLDVRPDYLHHATNADAALEGFPSATHLWKAWGSPTRPIEVWVIRFRIDPIAESRFLARSIVAGQQGAYTTNPYRAMDDEPEAVDDATLERFTATARQRESHRRGATQTAIRRMPLEDQAREYERIARMHHVSIRDELRAFWRWSDVTARRRQLERMRVIVEPLAA